MTETEKPGIWLVRGVDEGYSSEIQERLGSIAEHGVIEIFGISRVEGGCGETPVIIEDENHKRHEGLFGCRSFCTNLETAL